MAPLERTLCFLHGDAVDRPPFHPIVMRFAARYAGVKFRDFCLDPGLHVEAVLRTAHRFGIDWVSVMSDPYCEAEAYGMGIDYPEDDLPRDRGPIVPDVAGIRALAAPKDLGHGRLVGRVRQLELFRKRAGEEQFVVGWVEGPFAMYSLFRGLTDACLDLYDHPKEVRLGVEIAVEFAKRFASAQVNAGAHAVGMGDAVCSQISPEHYSEYFWEAEREIVSHIHSLGALSKLHICGNTSKILPDMIATGANIVDVDHLAGSMAPFAPLLGARQVLCGSSDPVSVVQDGMPEKIRANVERCWQETGGRAIVSAGCEITPGTSAENLGAMAGACVGLGS